MWTRMNDFNRMLDAMDRLRSNLNRVYLDYDRSYGDEFGWRTQNGFPRTNLSESGDSFQLIAEVPGLTKDDLNIRIQGNYLELSGTRKSDAPKDYKAQRVERDTASFTRSFTLPSEVDADKIEAVLQDGLLSLSLPKAEAAKPKQISIS
ncbi:Hsp20/alpha crystallin family protein [Desulfopila sp. IMCC35006]|uniref:Hsp20/alpha crystallin family protein n=1 Tax=Desulfopila sp. IMCC35006 TaxID=2569542 RepID=UPI0010AD3AC7|nr:Hsp20/alpha crystallin family protein [Desulfopila sp. IMCC35006]TKB25136.1 Hsp20/alpha crystallin family protein [Desulfopila sp. IMCC35006]